MLESIRIDRYIKVAPEIKKGMDLSGVKDSLWIEAFLFFMDSQNFSNKQIVISVSFDVCYFAFERDIGFFDNR
jgi:hypothetical protein